MGAALGLEHPEVATALSGMGNMEQVIWKFAYAEHSQPHNLTSDELALISKARDAYVSLTALLHRLQVLHAVSNDVDIPGFFEVYNEAMIIILSPNSARCIISQAGLKTTGR